MLKLTLQACTLKTSMSVHDVTSDWVHMNMDSIGTSEFTPNDLCTVSVFFRHSCMSNGCNIFYREQYHIIPPRIVFIIQF